MNFSQFAVLLIASSLTHTPSCSGFSTSTSNSLSFSMKAFLNEPIQIQRQQQQQLILQQQHRRHRIIAKMSSSSEEEEEEEPLSDELSKLIGKRASMTKSSSSTKTSSSSSSSSTIPKDNDENAISDPSFNLDVEALYEGKTGMDMFEMPEFKTKRPLKTPKEKEDKARGGGGSDGKDGSSSGDTYADYMAEYDDENDLHIPNRFGVSTIAWGDVDQGFKAGRKLKKKEIRAGKYLAGDLQVAYDKLMEAGILFMDSSESYGLKSRAKSLSAEQILSTCMDTNTDTQPIIGSAMCSPIQSLTQGTGMRLGQAGILKAIEGSNERLGSSAVDLYQVPTRMFYPGAPGILVDALSSAMDSGLINNIGISTMSKSSMKRFNQKLSKRGGYQVTSNSFEFSLINRKAWKSGLIAACKEEGIIPMARNPLGDGLASGVWTATNPTGGEVSKKQPFDFKTLDKYTTLHDVLANVQKTVKDRLEKQNRELTDRRNRFNAPPINTDITTSQIAINYVLAKGCVPIPVVKNPKDADEIIGCLGWELTDSEVKLLDNAADMSDKGQIV